MAGRGGQIYSRSSYRGRCHQSHWSMCGLRKIQIQVLRIQRRCITVCFRHVSRPYIIIIMFNISTAQISMWIWSNALYKSRGNQINLAQITILQLMFNKSNQMLIFDERGKPEYGGRGGGGTSQSRVENQQTQSTYDAECGNQIRATLVEGKCSHHEANPATAKIQIESSVPSLP